MLPAFAGATSPGVGRALLAIALTVVLPSTGRAQRPTRVDDRVRVQTSAGTFTGTVLSADSAHLVLRAERPSPRQLQLTAGDLTRIQVRTGRRSRLHGALLGLAAVSAIPVSATVLQLVLGGSFWPVDRNDRINFSLIYGTPVVGAIVGYSAPGHHWESAALPSSAALPQDTVPR